MNKKNKIICVSLLCSLFFISAINVSNAAPPSWVGVNTGDTFTWGITVNVDTALTLAEDLGFSEMIPTGFTEGLGTQETVKIKVRILDVTDQMTYSNINYVNVSCLLTLTIPIPITDTDEEIEFSHIIVEYDALNYTQELFEVLGSNEEGMTSIAGLFLPTDVNWAEFIAEVNAIQAMMPSMFSDIIITALTNGGSVSIPSEFLEQMFEEEGLFDMEVETQNLDDFEISITYNDNGVLDTAEVMYGTDVLFAVTLESGNGDEDGDEDGDEIPSYEISIVLITTIASTIGIIYYIKRKKHIL